MVVELTKCSQGEVWMQYLEAAEYGLYGLGVETRDELVVAASAMVDAWCRRPSLGVTQYVERLRFVRGDTVQLSHGPVTSLVGVRVRLRALRGFECLHPFAEVAEVFGAARAWSDVDVTTIDAAADGLLTFTPSVMGLPFDEAEVTYAAGFAEVPVPVKVACAQIVRNAQAMPALNVQRQSVDSVQMQYFSGALVDAEVQRLLQPFASERFGG